MKNVLDLRISILFSFAVLMSCSSDDDATDSVLDTLVGTWRASSIVFSDCLDSGENGTLSCDPFCIEITINSDGTYSLTEVDDDGTQSTESGTIEATATTILICETTEPNCTDPDPYILNGSNLVVTEAEDDISGCSSVISFEKQ